MSTSDPDALYLLTSLYDARMAHQPVLPGKK